MIQIPRRWVKHQPSALDIRTFFGKSSKQREHLQNINHQPDHHCLYILYIYTYHFLSPWCPLLSPHVWCLNPTRYVFFRWDFSLAPSYHILPEVSESQIRPLAKPGAGRKKHTKTSYFMGTKCICLKGSPSHHGWFNTKSFSNNLDDLGVPHT